MKTTLSSLCFTLILWVLFVPAQAFASLVEALSLQELSQRADVIALGSITSVRPVWNAERSKIGTHCVLHVSVCLKGQCGAQTAFVQRGGNMDGVSQVVVGEPAVLEGEELVVFLERVDGELRFLGLAQGKYKVIEQSGEKYAQGSQSELRVFDKGKQRAMVYEAQTLPLDVFISRIQNFLTLKSSY